MEAPGHGLLSVIAAFQNSLIRCSGEGKHSMCFQIFSPSGFLNTDNNKNNINNDDDDDDDDNDDDMMIFALAC